MTARNVMLGVLVGSWFVGCRPPTAADSPARTPAVSDRNPNTSHNLILSPSALDEAFLLSPGAPIRWRFLGEQFVVESWGVPLSTALCEQMLEEMGPVFRIGGHWDLLDNGHLLRLSQLQAEGPRVRAQADLPVEEGRDETLRVGGMSYVLSEHPDNREVLPDANFRARLVTVVSGHEITVVHDGQTETLVLAGVVSPPPDHPVGHQAIERAQELMQGHRLQIKIYDTPPQAPRAPRSSLPTFIGSTCN